MIETSQFIKSVCCNSPICLDFLRHEFSTDTVPVVCMRCKEDIAGAAIEDIDHGDKRLIYAYLDDHFNKWKTYMRTAHGPFLSPRGFLDINIRP